MTITPPTFPAANPVPITGFPLRTDPYTNITPFTYRNGMTFAELQEAMRTYMIRTLVPFIDSNGQALQTAWDDEVTQLVAAMNDAITEFISNQANINDATLDTIISDTESQTRALLNSLYGSATDVTNLETAVSTINDTLANRLSDATLQGEFADKATQTTVETGRLSDDSLQTEFAAKSTQTTVETGRLSDDSLQTEFAAKSTQTTVETGRLSDASLKLEFGPLMIRNIYANRPAPTTVPAGTVFICTNIPEQYWSDGTSWYVFGSGGNELASVAISGAAATGASATAADIAGTTITFIAGERPVMIEWVATTQGSVAGNDVVVYPVLDGTIMYSSSNTTQKANGTNQISGFRRVNTLLPGSTHTAKLQFAVTSGNGTVGTAYSDTELRVVTV